LTRVLVLCSSAAVPSARGASGGVRERGGIGSSEAGSPVEEVRGAKVGDRGSRRRPSVDAVLGRSLATVGPGSSASRVRRARGRVPRHPGGGLARPGEKPGSVRTHLRRWRPATDGRHNCRSREARDQERRAGGLVRLRQRRVAFLPHPSRARPPGREHGPGLPLPSGDRGCSFDQHPGPERPRERRRAPPLPNGLRHSHISV